MPVVVIQECGSVTQCTPRQPPPASLARPTQVPPLGASCTTHTQSEGADVSASHTQRRSRQQDLDSSSATLVASCRCGNSHASVDRAQRGRRTEWHRCVQVRVCRVTQWTCIRHAISELVRFSRSCLMRQWFQVSSQASLCAMSMPCFAVYVTHVQRA